MKKFTQLIHNRVTYNVYPKELYETEDVEELNRLFGPGISFVEISEDSPVDTGWIYNEETGEFTEPIPETVPEPEKTPELIKLEQLEQNMLNKDELDLDRDLMIMEIAMSLLI